LNRIFGIGMPLDASLDFFTFIARSPQWREWSNPSLTATCISSHVCSCRRRADCSLLRLCAKRWEFFLALIAGGGWGSLKISSYLFLPSAFSSPRG
jgi:hypothetical protein